MRLRTIIDLCSTIVILGSVIALVVWFGSDLEREYSGTLIVIDGDTVIIDGEKIRLEGIDAPEIHQRCGKKDVIYQCGAKSRQYLKSLMQHGNLVCKAWQRDKYERLLGQCSIGNTDINGKMVSDGWAVAYGAYYREENIARDASAGMWAGEFIRPREWRLEQGRAKSIN